MSQDIPPSFFNNPTLFEGTYLEFLGFKVAEWNQGYAILEMPVRSDHKNTAGHLHGGVIASLLDVAGALSGSYGETNNFLAVTVNLNCNYMAPHKAAEVLVKSELVSATNSLFFAQGSLLDPVNNRVCAIASGTYKKKLRK